MTTHGIGPNPCANIPGQVSFEQWTCRKLPIFETSISKGTSEIPFMGYLCDSLLSLWRYLISLFSPKLLYQTKDLDQKFSAISEERKELLENILNEFDPPSSKGLDRMIKLEALHYLYSFLKEIDFLLEDKNAQEFRSWISITQTPRSDFTFFYTLKTDKKILAKKLIDCLEKEYDKNKGIPFSFVLQARCNRILHSWIGGPIWVDKYSTLASVKKNGKNTIPDRDGIRSSETMFYSYFNAFEEFEASTQMNSKIGF